MSFILHHWPLTFVCAAMIAAAIVDGWKLKVPNWLTFPLVLSGWALGLLHNCGLWEATGTGGLGASLAGTVFGFVLLFPVYAIGGMGAGDVKMQMGFGAWVGAYYGLSVGLWTVLLAFCAGAIVGGVLAGIMILCRREFHRNVQNTREILVDLVSGGGLGNIREKAKERKPRLRLLPYGIPLCIGFLGYLFVSSL